MGLIPGAARLDDLKVGRVPRGEGLGMQPAGKTLLMVVCALVGRLALAEDPSADEVIANMRACAALHEDVGRLRCYDKEFRAGGPATAGATAPSAAAAPTAAAAAGIPATTRAAAAALPAVASGASGAGGVSPTAAGASAGVSPAATGASATANGLPATGGVSPAAVGGSAPAGTLIPALTPEQRFGLNPQLERQERDAASQPRELDRMTRQIASVARKLRGEGVFTLDNGQIWEQADADSQAIPKAGEQVTIRRGMLGAFYLVGRTAAFRVRRVK